MKQLIFPDKTSTRNRILFFVVSLIFIVSQAIFFQGFNGTDDLHYSLLAAKMLQGSFSLFVVNDVFSGRALLALLQAIVYFIFGISPFTTQIVTYAAAVGACYLTIFKLLHASSARIVLIASALFYFNPVISDIALGPSPNPGFVCRGVDLIAFEEIHNKQKPKNGYFYWITYRAIGVQHSFYKGERSHFYALPGSYYVA